MNIKSLPGILFGLIFSGLISIQLIAQEDLETRLFHGKIYNNQEKIRIKIEESVKDILSGDPVEIEGEYVYSTTVLPEFYANRDYMPAWDNFDVLKDAVSVLEGSIDDGLDPEDYHFHTMRKIIAKLEDKLEEEEMDYDWVAELDMLLTDAILLYAYHLLEGKVDPISLDANWNYNFREVSPEAPYVLERSIEEGTIAKTVLSLRPQNPAYVMYMELLAEFRDIAEAGGWGEIETGGVIKPGDSDPRIPQIRKRLQHTGDLTDETDISNEIYDTQLEEDIKKFQKRNALQADGIIGKGTFTALNVSVEEKIDILRVNMERDRWIMASITNDYILVNIAAFKAYYIRDGEFLFTTNVQVGKTYTQTPVFRERLRYIEFNPTWTVPVSITRKSIIPKMKEDENYLSTHHYELLDGSGNIIPNTSLDYESLTASNFSYTIRQKAGPWNALGTMKFIFPNKHAVYLHDTPSKSLFDRQDRTFSHGCIRTQNPIDLAVMLLSDSEWTRKKIEETLESKKTIRAFPNRTIDVMLLYWTAGYYEGDGIGFFRDVYNRDAEVLKELNTRDNRKPKDIKI